MTDARLAMWLVMSLVLIAMGASVSAKTGSTFYTPEMVANARRNIERYDWAKKMRDAKIVAADNYADRSYDWLWDLPTPQSIPRGIHVSVQMGCPKCGHAIDKFGNYPWKIDVFQKPWKLTCPSCGEVFPKNDFARFYESGKDANGVFVYEKADRSLLYNSEHPDPKDPLHTYGVDDTRGWLDEKGNVYRFIGYYGHYGAWADTSRAVSNMSTAYICTGNPKYARKAGLILYRIAQLYPDMDYSFWANLGFSNSDGGSGLGKIYGRIWETGLVNSFMEAYDAVYPGLDDPQLLAELSKRTGVAVTVTHLRKSFEGKVIRLVHDGILSRTIEGNEGMYQNTMATAAVVLDEPGTSQEWLDWIFQDANVSQTHRSGGNMHGIFKTKVDDDGMGNEASPAYNSIWRTLFKSVTQILQRYPRYTRNSFVDNPKYRKMFEVPVRLSCTDRFSPHIGDTGSTGSRGLASISVTDLVYAFRTWGDPKFAQMAHFVNGHKTDGIRGDLYDPEPEKIATEIRAAIEKHGELSLRTDNMPSYGCAVLRSGNGDNARALSLYYGRNTGHGHKDTLNIELFGFGLNLMPDLGYPEYASADCASRYEWTSHTISHNTVTVDRKRQEANAVGQSRFVVEGKGISVAEVSADKPYPQSSLYQRTTAMVDVSDEDFYVLDIFRVEGGKEHVYSLHGAEGEVETEGLNLVNQLKGTLAGEDVAPYADLGFKQTGWTQATGYQYLYDVRRDAKPPALSAVTYKVVDTWRLLKEPKDMRLRLNLISPPGEVILAHGDPPRNKPGNPKNLQYVLLPNHKGDSTFVSVIEPYIGSRTISKIERTDSGDTVFVTVTTASGRVDRFVSTLEPRKNTLAGTTISGRFALVSEENGNVETKLLVP